MEIYQRQEPGKVRFVQRIRFSAPSNVDLALLNSWNFKDGVFNMAFLGSSLTKEQKNAHNKLIIYQNNYWKELQQAHHFIQNSTICRADKNQLNINPSSNRSWVIINLSSCVCELIYINLLKYFFHHLQFHKHIRQCIRLRYFTI